jgi:hypothetical protein
LEDSVFLRPTSCAKESPTSLTTSTPKYAGKLMAQI